MVSRFEKILEDSLRKVASEKYKQGFLDGVYMVSAYGIEETKRLLKEDKRDLHVIADDARLVVEMRGALA